jgi:hypothetical protein
MFLITLFFMPKFMMVSVIDVCIIAWLMFLLLLYTCALALISGSPHIAYYLVRSLLLCGA